MNGILILDKPSGLTSTKVVNKVKKLMGMKKAGHTGTLDPFATGVLPICFNQATKAIPYLKEDFKEYEAEMIIGITTDTMDSTGKIISEKKTDILNNSEIEEVLKSFCGEQNQVPPMFSAVRVGGVRLYKLARKGKEVERKPRKIFIEEIELLEYDHPVIRYKVKCSKGTYVRVLACEIGKRLGYGGHLKNLIRLSSGKFKLEDATNIEDIEKGNYKLLTLKEVLSENKNIEVENELAEKIMTGMQLTKLNLDKIKLPNFKKEDIITIHFNERVISICKALIDKNRFEYALDEDIIFQHLRVFN
ncbi:MAG: tRNA pseudouridine(55) synthase TruB [Candidatus Dadabacteria bacterium]|nr:tRNA pseudouridine(55) synthase TruB [Candidatus Dadabacteria bacterium]NIQ16367.1 tRNA pseudouridine(55) synthase TruB [Candidatus Dadabacteria bacterium]